MEINFSGPILPYQWKTVTNESAAQKPEVVDNMTFDQTDALEKKLDDVPDLRPEAVARARQLMVDGKYPSPEALSKIANLIASRLAYSDSN